MLEQKTQEDFLDSCLKKYSEDKNYKTKDFVEDIKSLYEEGILPEEIISEKLNHFLNEEFIPYYPPSISKIIYNAFSKELERYMKRKINF